MIRNRENRILLWQKKYWIGNRLFRYERGYYERLIISGKCKIQWPNEVFLIMELFGSAVEHV